MADVLFKGVSSQYIDSDGKARMLSYSTGWGGVICLMISPIPPLNVPEDKTIKPSSFAAAMKFIKDKGLAIKKQDGTHAGGIQGLWVEPSNNPTPGTGSIYFGYIPIIPQPGVALPLKNIPFSTRNDPLRTDATSGRPEGAESRTSSELDSFRRNRILAEILKQYVLYTYARDPDNFDENYLWVNPSHNYDIEKLNKRLFFDGNNVMYDEGYLIVPSEGIKKGLLAFLQISLLNDRFGVLDIVNNPSISNYYQTISDFRKRPDQLIFTNKSGVLRWMKDASIGSGEGENRGSRVSSIPLPKETNPYYYRNTRIRADSLMLVQNVSGGTLDAALSVANEWRKARVSTGSVFNVGYYPPTLEDTEVSYIIYTELGEYNREMKGYGARAGVLNVLWYEDGSHAALLFFA